MKHIIKFFFLFIISFLFIMRVNAANTTIKMTCPSTVDIDENFTCTVYATVSGSTAKEIPLKLSMTGPITKVDESLNNTNVSPGTNKKIGTISFKARNSSGTAQITLKIDGSITYVNGSYSNAGTARTYSVKVRSNINTLSSIKLDNSKITGFNKNTTSYTVSTTKSRVVLSATKTSSKSKVSGTGTKNLKCGSNVYSLKVTAENGDTKNYTVGIRRVCDTNIFLENINVSEGKLSPNFSKTETSYEVKVSKNIDKITVTGVRSSTRQTITGNVTNKKLNYGSNKINITVTSETGARQVYTINVIREDNTNTNIYLSSLSLSSGTIDFNKNTFEYETKVLYEIENIEVLAVPEEETSKVAIKGNENLKVGDNYITVTVSSESGEKKSYVIKVTRLKEGETLGDNPNIKNIIILGYDFEFNPDKTDYKLVIDDEDKLDIEVIMEDESATYEIKGNENLKDGSVITIKTTASDGSSNEYTITVTKSDYTIYFIIAGGLLFCAIVIPIIVYLKSVRKKKENLDVNGYRIGEGYEEKDYSRTIIANNSNISNEHNTKRKKKFSFGKKIKQIEIPDDSKMSTPQTEFNQEIDKNGFDSSLQAYSPGNMYNNTNDNINNYNQNINNNNYQNENFVNNQNFNYNNNLNNNQNVIQDINQGLKCPNCGRELLGNPEICPYCNMKLR